MSHDRWLAQDNPWDQGEFLVQCDGVLAREACPCGKRTVEDHGGTLYYRACCDAATQEEHEVTDLLPCPETELEPETTCPTCGSTAPEFDDGRE